MPMPMYACDYKEKMLSVEGNISLKCRELADYVLFDAVLLLSKNTNFKTLLGLVDILTTHGF
mgnify:FL=1